MATTGTKQSHSKQLEGIIRDFSRAMRTAYKPFVANFKPSCEHVSPIAFTGSMQTAWEQYVEWCRQATE